MNTHSFIAPFSLEGTHVRLEPLRPEHAPLLWEIVKEHLDDMFRWIPYRLQSLQDFESVQPPGGRGGEARAIVPFATLERSSGKVVGTTRYMNMDLPTAKSRSDQPGSLHHGRGP